MAQPTQQKHRDVASPSPEDEVLERLLETLGIEKDWCVEFGAWDGKHLSNTWKLMQEGWSGVFIEGSTRRYRELVKNYAGNPNAHCVNGFVNFEGPDSLDGMLARTPIPKDFAVLSIDIDGNDYHIWKSVVEYRPKIVVIEFNPTIPPHVEFVQPRDMSVQQGNSLKSMTLLAREKGYELVAATFPNAFFVRKEDFSLFGMTDNSPDALFPERKWLMDVFQLYDGTLVLTGERRMLWHRLDIPASFQPIPRVFRQFPGSMGGVKGFLFRKWRSLHRYLAMLR